MVKNITDERFSKLVKVVENQKSLPIYKSMDFVDLVPQDYPTIYEIVNGKDQFAKIVDQEWLGILFFRILHSYRDYELNAMTKVAFTDVVKSGIVNEFSKNILIDGNNLWLKSKKWELVAGDMLLNEFMLFISKAIFLPGLFPLSMTELDRIPKSVANACSVVGKNKNNVIQFENYHIIDGKLIEGIYKHSLPKFMIDEKIVVDKNITLNKYTKDLIMHLTNYRKDAYEALIDTIAMIFINNVDVKNAVAKTVYLYGRSGANGKSTLENHIAKIVGEDNSHSIADVDDKSDRFQALNSLVCFLPDSSRHLDNKACEFIKQLTTADKMSGRDLYKSAVSDRFTTQIILASNHLLRAEDKSKGLIRRIFIISSDEKLVRPDSFFTELRKKETINNARSFFVNRAMDIMTRKGHTLHSYSESDKLLRVFMDNNDSAAAFLTHSNYKEIDINYLPTRKLYDEYLTFCYDVGIGKKNTLKMNNFNQAIERILEVEQRRVLGSRILNKLQVSEVYVGNIDEKPDTRFINPDLVYLRETNDLIDRQFFVWVRKSEGKDDEENVNGEV